MTLGTIAILVASVAAAWLGSALGRYLARPRLIRARLASLRPAIGVIAAFAVVTASPWLTLVAFGLATNLTLEPIDGPGYDWLVGQAAVTGTAHDVIDFLTQAGDPAPMALVCAVGMLAFTIGWNRPDRIIVPLLVGGTFLSAWVLQRVTEYIVGRDSPPLGAGTFPSGGSARILYVTVLIVLLAAMRWHWPIARRRIGFLPSRQPSARWRDFRGSSSSFIGRPTCSPGSAYGGRNCTRSLRSSQLCCGRDALPDSDVCKHDRDAWAIAGGRFVGQRKWRSTASCCGMTDCRQG